MPTEAATATTDVSTRRSYRCYHCNYSFHITTTTSSSTSSFRCPYCHHRHLLPHHTISPTPPPPPPPPPTPLPAPPLLAASPSSSAYTSSSDEDNSFVDFTTDYHPKQTPASKAFVDSLSAIKLDSATASQSCPICMDDLGINSKANRLPCQHVFHRDCIVPWLNRTHTCPLCRYKLPQEPALPSPEDEPDNEEDGFWEGNHYYLALRPGVNTIVQSSNGTIIHTNNGTTRTIIRTSNGTTRTIVRRRRGAAREFLSEAQPTSDEPPRDQATSDEPTRTFESRQRGAAREFPPEAQTTSDEPPQDGDGDTLMVDA